MPMPARDEMTDAQRAAADEISAGPRGEITGPFVALLRNPELLQRVQAVGAYVRFTDLAISAAVREITVLAVARFWEQAFEWAHHLPLAVAAGVPERACEQLRAGERPRDLPDDLESALRIVDELQRDHRVSDDTYALALQNLGETGVVEITTIAGYYTTLAMVMNMAQVQSATAVTFGHAQENK